MVAPIKHAPVSHLEGVRRRSNVCPPCPAEPRVVHACPLAKLGSCVSPRSTKPFDFWGAASGLAERVKQGTAELAHTVRDTDWRAEIQAFGEDLAEETEELGASAVAAAQHAVDNIEHLPQTVRPA